MYKVTSPGKYPDSETKPMGLGLGLGVGDVQKEGNTFTLACDFPNYRDENGIFLDQEGTVVKKTAMVDELKKSIDKNNPVD